ncbi:DUF1631 family protein [Noviherbaspirillum sp. UKPF54]|uniref:DUF1631 family protein n=1 Tax=Noviherbaspirillum sp. UKPF54 TaxID=2601898 RepID=UPI00143D9E91|nr:DUF1631 family protein [Noviherbaspirillum sp. UKPF54]
MADTEYKRLLDSAKDRAFFGFLALIQRAMQDADKAAGTQQAAASGLSQSALMSLRHFLRQDSSVLLRRVETLLRTYLDRAMQTMYVDLRPGLHNVTADDLSLIDDEAVNLQIEVGRLAQRMRDADAEGIGRLNVIISQMHGHHDAKERENPFRPYLLARVLYEAVRDTVGDEAKVRLLFEHLAEALLPHLPGYYGAIRQVFESSGVHGKFIAQQSRAAHFQRYYGAPAAGASAQFASRVIPELQRMVEVLQQNASAHDIAGGQTVHDMIRAMLGAARPAPRGAAGTARSGMVDAAGQGSASLAARLGEYQKKVAQGEAIDAGRAQERNQLFVLRDGLAPGTVSAEDRMTMEVVAMLFEFILEDEQIPVRLRDRIGRLQVPILKAALLDPTLMHDEAHPARQLLNRLASAAVAADPLGKEGRELTGEIERIVDHILRGFDRDMAIFAASLKGFESFLAQHLRQDHAHTAPGVEAVEMAEKISILLTNITGELCGALVPLNADKRITDFIIHVWPQVLVRAAWADRDRKIDCAQADSAFQAYRAVLPDLLWSIQGKHNPQDRAALIRLLPDLVKRLNQAMRLIQMPEEDSRQIMDQLVTMHTQMLRGQQKDAAQPVARARLEQDFGHLAISWERVAWTQAESPQPRPDLIEEVVAHYGVPAALHLGVNTVAAAAADREFLAQTYLIGTRVEMRADQRTMPAQLVWISTHRSLYLFRQDDGGLAIYTSAALLEALRDAAIVPVEYAPVFERAVESLLFGADKIRSGVA